MLTSPKWAQEKQYVWKLRKQSDEKRLILDLAETETSRTQFSEQI